MSGVSGALPKGKKGKVKPKGKCLKKHKHKKHKGKKHKKRLKKHSD
jgi:hypothetical protein